MALCYYCTTQAQLSFLNRFWKLGHGFSVRNSQMLEEDIFLYMDAFAAGVSSTASFLAYSKYFPLGSLSTFSNESPSQPSDAPKTGKRILHILKAHTTETQKMLHYAVIKSWCLSRWNLILDLRCNNHGAETVKNVNAMILNSHTRLAGCGFFSFLAMIIQQLNPLPQQQGSHGLLLQSPARKNRNSRREPFHQSPPKNRL